MPVKKNSRCSTARTFNSDVAGLKSQKIRANLRLTDFFSRTWSKLLSHSTHFRKCSGISSGARKTPFSRYCQKGTRCGIVNILSRGPWRKMLLFTNNPDINYYLFWKRTSLIIGKFWANCEVSFLLKKIAINQQKWFCKWSRSFSSARKSWSIF